METKGKKGVVIAIVVLAACIVLGIAMCLFLKINQRTEKLDKTMEQIESTEDTTTTVSEEKQVEGTVEAFSSGDGTTADSKTKDVVEEDAEKNAANSEDYLCSYSTEREITAEDVESLKAGTYTNLPADKDILRMVINEMYAKYGYEFSDADIQSYFDQKQWYQNITDRNDDMDIIYQGMTDIEKTNIDFLTKADAE